MPKRSADVAAWLLQTTASVCWAASVFAYGSFETGDVLQLTAALSWTLSNVATLISDRSSTVAEQKHGAEMAHIAHA